jgi:hypothetical protein
MAIKTYKTAVVNGEDYELLSSALELARRYIDKNHVSMTNKVDEFDEKEVHKIQRSMDRFWE